MSGIEHKPTARYRVRDWHEQNARLAERTRAEAETSLELRQSAGTAANEAAVKTLWDHHHNSTLLRERLGEVAQWRTHLEQAVAAVDEEVAELSRAKTAAEDELEARHFDLETACEALAQREARLSGDVVRDDVEEALKQEIESVSEFRQRLRERGEQCFEQLCRLAEARLALLDDISAKEAALHVDSGALALTPSSPDVSLKPHCTRVPQHTRTVPRWEEASRERMAAADYQLAQSRALRAAAADTAAAGHNTLAQRHETVQFASRRRLHELQHTADDLHWQRQRMEEELAETEREIRCLEGAIREKQPYRKLAETRLERRMERPPREGVFDPAWSGLRAEASNVQETQSVLEQQLQQLWSARHRLRAHLARLNDSISVKENSLRVEQQCAETHRRSRPAPLPTTRSHLHKVLLLRPASSTYDRSRMYDLATVEPQLRAEATGSDVRMSDVDAEQ